jgi:hypothetical protein
MSDDDVLRDAEGHEGYEWREEPDVITSISEDELRIRLGELSEEEREISYRRRVIQGRIDLIRTELVRRGGVALPPEELARVLIGGEGRAEARRKAQGEDQGTSPPERGEGR